MFNLLPTTERPPIDYALVNESLGKINVILNDATSLVHVEVAERMFNNFLHMFSSKQERSNSAIIYGIQMSINNARSKFEQSNESVYDAPAGIQFKCR